MVYLYPCKQNTHVHKINFKKLNVQKDDKNKGYTVFHLLEITVMK